MSFSQVKSTVELEKIRKDKVAAQLAILQNEKDLDKKQRALQALQFVGHEEVLQAIKPYLQDAQLRGAALRALAAIYPFAKDPVKAIFQEEINKSTGDKLVLAQALIQTRQELAVTMLESMYPQADSRVNQLILHGLAQFAKPSSKKIIQQAAERSNFKFEPTQAFEAYVLYAKNTKSETDLMNLFKNATVSPAGKSLVASALLAISSQKNQTALQLINDSEKAVSKNLLTSWIKTANKADWQSMTKKFGGLSLSKQIELLDALAENPTKESTDFLKSIQSKNTHVRTSLALALLRVQKEAAFNPVWNLLGQGNLDAIAVGQALKNVSLNETLKKQWNGFDQMSSAQQSAAILYASSRKWEAVIPQMWRAIQSNNATRLAGFLALPEMVKVTDFDLVAGKIGQTTEYEEVKALHASLNQLLKTTPEFGLKLHGFASKANHPENYVNYLNEGESLSLVYKVAKKSHSEDALRAYVRINAKLNNTTQQILNYRNALALTNNPLVKEDIYRRMLKCPSIVTIQVLKEGVKSMANKSTIADGLVAMFVGNSDLQGQMTKEWMQEIMPFVSSAELRDQLNKEFAKTAGKTGFYMMFNGRDLSGWKGLVDNPIKRRQMHPDTLAKKQIKADEIMRKGWYAKDGELHFTGHGENLCSIKDYQDFEMYVDWKIEKEGDAGIYLRGSPQVQIWDIANLRVGANVGSGGLYNNQKNPSKPPKVADNPIEEWNTFRIIMKGERVTVYLNGELVVDNVILENYWDRKLPIFVKDAIELQAHGNHIVYRDIYVKELEPQSLFDVSKEEKQEGFEALFDGQSLFQWTGNTIDYVPENGELVIYPTRGGKGNIYTKKEYGNFHLKFDFKLTPGANNGLGIRTPLEGDAAYVGMELQILDNTAKMYEKLQPYQYHGSVYGIIPAKRDFLKPVGEWNTEEVIAQGNHIQVILNGEIILDGDLAEATKNGTADHKEHPGLFNKTGHIGFLGHGSEVRFKNIRIKELGDIAWKKPKKK